MLNQFSRTELLLGQAGVKKLNTARIAVFGIGGVGGYSVEALARSGVGCFDLIDHDKVGLSNINRQIIATHKTLGKYKVDAMKERILEINPIAIVNTHKCFYTPDTLAMFDFSQYTYIIDAIDTVSSKIELILRAQQYNVPIISCMGAGNKLDPTRLEVSDIYKTSVCPLAKVMRKELRARGVTNLKVVYSKEPVIKPLKDNTDSNCDNLFDTDRKCNDKRQITGSVSYVPSVAGLIMAGEVIRDII